MRLITWNIQWGRGADGRVDLGRIVDTLRSMDPADVICLQEVAQNVEGLAGAEPDDGPAVLAAAFADYEPVYGPGVDVPARAGGRARFGNLMLSRLPVDQVFRHLLPFPADASVPGMQRGCIEAVVAAPSGPVRVLTTHLEYYSVRQRTAQVEALRALQAERSLQERAGAGTSKESCPVFASRPRPPSAILCGDFNFEPDSPEHALMGESTNHEGVCFVDAWRALCGTVPHAPTVGLHGAEWPDRTYCCDFFWVSRDLVPRLQSITVDAATAASDHQPILLEIDS
ncbi:MAG TPA: endonuclease/exonuclease/phosphatase family protein [Rhodocyclaceae bacterium]|nr:endonuclease/exonuclease/phosphatase family protein [Rhodocyclaceae bacterium]HRQ47678.1 endonuclease/exonuclease/phosphatase family protein [Rhodocyclaceae bacterium]